MLNWRFLNKARSDREALWRGSARGEPHCALEPSDLASAFPLRRGRFFQNENISTGRTPLGLCGPDSV
jgi:hypothetical protein